MQVETVPLDSLLLDPSNANTHPDFNLEVLKGSYAKFGQQKPLVVGENNVVIAGNGQLLAARALGWKTIAIVRSNLRGSDATAFGIADNKTAESSKWDYETLQELIEGLQGEGYEVESLGFADHELETILAAAWEPPTPSDDPDAQGIADEHNTGNAKPIAVTPAQRETIDRAIERVRLMNDDTTLTEGRCLELACADWLAGQ